MSFFKIRKPRGYHHEYIYYDERKERLAQAEERAKRELGLLPPKKFDPEEVRGKYIQATKHLRRRKESGKKPVPAIILIAAIVGLIMLMKFLAS